MSSTTTTLSSARNRLAVLSRHLTGPTVDVKALLESECVDSERVLDLLKLMLQSSDKSDHQTKGKVIEMIKSNPKLFDIDHHDFTMNSKRDLIVEQIKYLSAHGAMRVQDLFERPLTYFAVAEILTLWDPTLAIKLGVHFTLFGGAVASLGTAKHSQYVEAANNLELKGCFGLTEMGHGSNARAVETIATYDASRNEFIIHSPTVMAQKYFIGGAVNGTHCVVFAQLFLGDPSAPEDCGVQAFVVPLRDPSTGQLYPTVRVKDCGHKMGLQGIDNGRIMFEHHRVSGDNLLDKFGYVTPEGKYVTEIKSNAIRFATMIGALVYGRVGLTFGAIGVSKLALITAIKYSSERLQFGPPGKPEIPILDFLSHQRRLFPLLAKTYAYHFALKKLLEQVQSKDQKKLHILAAGMKALATWHVNDTLSTARQCTGGQGYLSEARIGEMKANMEIYTTFEGDNVVLLQQVAASLLKEFKEQFTKGNIYSGIFNYVADGVTVRVKEANPLNKRRTVKDHLLSSSFHHDALRFRKKKLTSILASQLRTLSKTKDFFEAWNESLDLALAAATAHIDYVVFKEFAANLRFTLLDIKGQPGSHEVKQLLKRVKNLYAISILQQNAAFYLEEHYFAASKAKAITRQLNELCAVIRPSAVLLCNAFNMDPFFIPPIGKSNWVEHNQM